MRLLFACPYAPLHARVLRSLNQGWRRRDAACRGDGSRQQGSFAGSIEGFCYGGSSLPLNIQTAVGR